MQCLHHKNDSSLSSSHSLKNHFYPQSAKMSVSRLCSQIGLDLVASYQARLLIMRNCRCSLKGSEVEDKTMGPLGKKRMTWNCHPTNSIPAKHLDPRDPNYLHSQHPSKRQISNSHHRLEIHINLKCQPYPNSSRYQQH